MSKQHIKNYYPRDQKALMGISRCGHARYESLKEIVADKRLWCYEKDNLVEKVTFNSFNGKEEVGYKLTASGKRFVEREYGFSGHQTAQSLHHDLGISDKYFSQDEEHRELWKTETEARQRYEEEKERLRIEDYDRFKEIEQMEQEHKISAVDAIIVNELGIEESFEVETNNYGQAEIQQKINFCEVLKISYESVRV